MASNGADGLPPWMEAAVSEGIVFHDTPITESPPWLAAAAESGIIFFDPDGDEVVIPSSKVGAFKDALQSVCDFEESDGSLATAGKELQSSAEQHPTHNELSCADVSGEALLNTTAKSAAEETESQRTDLKRAVQKRYYLLSCLAN